MRVGILATYDAYRQHVQPIWDALAVSEQAAFTASSLGIRQDDADVWLTASARDFRSLRTRVERPRVAMEHGCGLQWGPGYDLDILLAASVIAAPNQYVAERYRQLSSRTRVEVVGTPKMDGLCKVPAPGDGTIATSFHWSGIRGQRRTTMDVYGEALGELAKSHHVIGHAHPKVWAYAEKQYEALGIEPVQHFADVVRLADVYAADHSSTLFEWAALQRPVVLLERYGGQALVPHASGLRYDTHAGIGREVKPADLASGVATALAGDPAHRAQREASAKELYPYLGSSTGRVIDLLREVAG